MSDVDERSASGSGSGSESDELEKTGLIATRAKRSTAGNLYATLRANLDDEELQKELLAEDADDAGEYEGSDREDDEAAFDSSSDDSDDAGPPAEGQAEDLTGEKELKKAERVEAGKKRKAKDARLKLPSWHKKKQVKLADNVKTSDGPEERPKKKKSDRTSWIVAGIDGATRQSSRAHARASREITHANLKESHERSEKQRKVMKNAAEREKGTRRMDYTLEERLLRAAKIEKETKREFGRWEREEAERQRIRDEILAAKRQKGIEGPYLRFWSGSAIWQGNELRVKRVISETQARKEEEERADNEEDELEKATQEPKAEKDAVATDADKQISEIAGDGTSALSSQPRIVVVESDATKEPQDVAMADADNTNEAKAVSHEPRGDESKTVQTADDGVQETNEPLQANHQEAEANAEREIETPVDASAISVMDAARPEDKQQEDSAMTDETSRDDVQQATLEESNTHDTQSAEGPKNIPTEEMGLTDHTSNDVETGEGHTQDSAAEAGVKDTVMSDLAPPTENPGEDVPVSLLLEGMQEYASTVPKATPAGASQVEGATATTESPWPSFYYPSAPVLHSPLTRPIHLKGKGSAKLTGTGESATKVPKAPTPPPLPLEQAQRHLLILDQFPKLSSVPPPTTKRSAKSTSNLEPTDVAAILLPDSYPSFNQDEAKYLTVKALKKRGGDVPPKPRCAITAWPAKYRDPKTGLAYADMHTYKILQRILAGGCQWSSMLGAWVGPAYGPMGRPAHGVPEGFARPRDMSTDTPPAASASNNTATAANTTGTAISAKTTAVTTTSASAPSGARGVSAASNAAVGPVAPSPSASSAAPNATSTKVPGGGDEAAVAVAPSPSTVQTS